MTCYKIEGGKALHGTVDVHGAKNAALPILAATIINGGKNIIHNCPELSDVSSILDILVMLGCSVVRKGKDVFVDSSSFRSCNIPENLMRETRSSSLFAGALIARCSKAFISGSGGCCIGKRPIDLHLAAFRSMGIGIGQQSDGVLCIGSPRGNCVVTLDFPSVGATENTMLVSSVNSSVTVINNAAREPEIVNLADYLRSIGVSVRGDGTDRIVMKGTHSFRSGEVTVIPDRIVASTYLSAVACAGGEIYINAISPSLLSTVIGTYRKMGLHIDCYKDGFAVKKTSGCVNPEYISTDTFPGFPTDCQPLLVASMATSRGVGSVREKIFENRFSHCHSLNAMGADISVKGRMMTVNGMKKLSGATVDAHDLRCGAALCVAALGADGISCVNNIRYIDRGYESLCDGFRSLGATIERSE